MTNLYHSKFEFLSVLFYFNPLIFIYKMVMNFFGKTIVIALSIISIDANYEADVKRIFFLWSLETREMMKYSCCIF